MANFNLWDWPDLFPGAYNNSGNDSINGNGGWDTIYGGAGADTINGGNDADIIYGEAGNDIIRDAVGPDGGIDFISGGGGNDSVFGGFDNDSLYGDANNDTIVGGEGRDIMHGGSGSDIFVWGKPDTGPGFRGAPNIGDRINDFARGEGDKIDLSRIDADLSTFADDPFTTPDHHNRSTLPEHLKFDETHPQPNLPLGGLLVINNEDGTYEVLGRIKDSGNFVDLQIFIGLTNSVPGGSDFIR